MNLQGSCTNCFCPLSFHEETAIIDLLWIHANSMRDDKLKVVELWIRTSNTEMQQRKDSLIIIKDGGCSLKIVEEISGNFHIICIPWNSFSANCSTSPTNNERATKKDSQKQGSFTFKYDNSIKIMFTKQLIQRPFVMTYKHQDLNKVQRQSWRKTYNG